MPVKTTVLEVAHDDDGIVLEKVRAQTDGEGWVLYDSSDLPASVSIRFAEVRQRLVPVEVRINHDEGVTVGLLRKVPLGRLEALANSSGIADTIRQALSTQRQVDDATHSHTAEKVRVTGVGKVSARGTAHSTGSARAWIWPKDARVDVPTVRPYPDSFYQAVAMAYDGLLESGRPPAPTIAEANKVPVTTVHRWVRETRKRGFLPPATPGKAG